MPVQVTYPGVYVEEVSSGVRTITGVATSITAFVGRATRGPVDTAVVINSYADYERTFGGLAVDSMMSFAVQDFYRNGGSQAVIVRLYNAEAGTPELATLSVGDGLANIIELEAAYPGAWGNALSVTIDHIVSAEVATQQGLSSVDDLFNIIIVDGITGAREQYLNVSVVSGPRQISNVLTNQSSLVLVEEGFTLPIPLTRPAADVYSVTVANQASNGSVLGDSNYIGPGLAAAKQGLYALDETDIFNLLCLPPDWNIGTIDSYPGTLLADAITYSEARRAIVLVDPPSDWQDTSDAVSGISSVPTSTNAAIYFPRLRQPNPLRDNQMETFVPCGAVAGIMSRTDTQRGVWKAPAGIEATLRGVPELSVNLTDAENGQLNPLGVNCLRSFPVIGRIVWGARTRRGSDILASEWKYVPVRRLALFIEETLFRGTQWVVFEPNDEPLWAQIRLNIGSFMHNLFRQGAFQGTTPNQAYFVKCDSETTTQSDIDRGIVNIVVGFAPLKPAEFVIIKLQQIAGELEV